MALVLGLQEPSQGHHLPVQVALVLITHHLPGPPSCSWLFHQDPGLLQCTGKVPGPREHCLEVLPVSCIGPMQGAPGETDGVPRKETTAKLLLPGRLSLLPPGKQAAECVFWGAKPPGGHCLTL